YPSDRVMAFLSEHKIPVILSSDAHETRHLTAGFDEAMKLVEKFDLNLVYDYKTVENRQEVSE
ncbi:MAG: hypothetical protein IK046_04185, partial [Clostridia bacterium]|nr:hypothetical protein [Clostridia bacterium]